MAPVGVYPYHQAMSLLQIDRLSMAFGADLLFEAFSTQLGPGDRVALIGDNGVGKSTLLRLLAGLEHPSEGIIHRTGSVRIAYLPQTARLDDAGTLRQAMERPFGVLREMEGTLRRLEASIARGDASEEELHQYDEHLQRFQQAGGYEIEARLRAALVGVGLAMDQLDVDIRRLSGGEEARAALARVLVEAPDVLLLDEPTNHLDFEALDWLEETLFQLSGALVLVSHDRHLLDHVSNKTWEIAFEEVAVYGTGYTRSREQREIDRTRRLEAFEHQEETIEKYRDFIRRHKAGQKVRQAKDREKKLERIEQARIERPRDARRISLRIPMSEPSGKRVLTLRGLQIGYDRPLIHLPDIELYRGEKVAVIGSNGCGKTTLLNTLLGEIPPLAGSAEPGHRVNAAAFRQRQEGLHGKGSVLDAILSRTSLSISEARGLLGRFLFSGDDVSKRMDHLSGGERSRVALALLSLAEGNLLMLDEPTNHLDLASQEILEQALRTYPGTVLLVSHDRALLEAVTTQVWWVDDGRLHVLAEGYAAYRARRREQSTGAAQALTVPRKPKASLSAATRDRHKGDRRRDAARVQLENEIESLEQQIRDLEEQLVSASTSGDAKRVAALGVEHAAAQATLEETYGDWNALAEEDD